MTRELPSGEAYCPTCDRSFAASTAVCPDDGTRLVDLSRPVDPLIGREIDGRFTIRERLGAGGMGVVYRAWQASVGREVAIKVIAPRPGDDNSTAKRFLREAKLASQLAQPNIVMVIDFGATGDGTLYLAMELLRGRTLSQVMREDGRFTPARARRVWTQLCDALESAHAAGIVHRDLKPANVMILDEPRGRDFVKVLDFGLAKALDAPESTTLTQSDRVVGTPSYMAPEVITGAPAEPRSDLYSLGVMLFEVLAGKLPFAAPNANVMLAKHAYAPIPEMPEVPRQVAHVVHRLLAKRPEQRYASAAEVRDALDAAIEGRLPIDPASDQALLDTGEVPELDVSTAPATLASLSATPPTTAEPLPPRRPRRARVVIAAIAFAAIAGGVAAVFLVPRGSSSPPPVPDAAALPVPVPVPVSVPVPDAAVAIHPDAAPPPPPLHHDHHHTPPRPTEHAASPPDAGVTHVAPPAPPPDAGPHFVAPHH